MKVQTMEGIHSLINTSSKYPTVVKELKDPYTYLRNETSMHQQLSLHQLHHHHPSQRFPKRFFLLPDITRSIYLRMYKNIATCIERALLFTIDKLLSGSSLEGKAFFKKPQNSEAFLLLINLQHKTLISKACYFWSCS